MRTRRSHLPCMARMGTGHKRTEPVYELVALRSDSPGQDAAQVARCLEPISSDTGNRRPTAGMNSGAVTALRAGTWRRDATFISLGRPACRRYLETAQHEVRLMKSDMPPAWTAGTSSSTAISRIRVRKERRAELWLGRARSYRTSAHSMYCYPALSTKRLN
jgi:hypothetical protein